VVIVVSRTNLSKVLYQEPRKILFKVERM